MYLEMTQMRDLSDRCLDDVARSGGVRPCDAPGVWMLPRYGEFVLEPSGRVLVHDSHDRCRGYLSNRVAQAVVRSA